MSQANVLVVGGDEHRRQSLVDILRYLEYEHVYVADYDADWQELRREHHPEILLLAPGEGERGVGRNLKSIRSANPHLPIILLTEAHSENDPGKEAADDAVAHVSLPLRQQDFERALEQAHVYVEDRRRVGKARCPELFRNLAGSSKAIRKVRLLIERVARTEATVLILGESGTGKEVVARNIHYHSLRRHRPFVPVNCGAIPSELLESELFGHEKGAFTGAISARRGRFELAEGGTLFLDEVGDMPLAMQVKLLRVLQEKTFERVGSNKTIEADVRVIAATHRHLPDSIAAGTFREDLYYRMNVFPIEMPSLRDRIGDLAVLVNDLITRVGHESGLSVRFTPEALSALSSYSWPGNVRELANLIERLAILYPDGEIGVQQLPEKYRAGQGRAETPELGEASAPPGHGEIAPIAHHLPPGGLNLKDYLSTIECTLIKQALDEADGVIAHAAKRLMLGRTTLAEKLRKYGLFRDESPL